LKSRFIDKLIEKVDRIEPGEMQQYLIQLVQQKGFFEKVFEALREGVIVTDIGGNIHYINAGACAFFGLKQDEALGTKVDERIRGLDWERLISGERTVVSRDMEVFYPENRYLNFYVTPLSEDGEVLGEHDPSHVMLIRDITQRRRVEEEKMESERISALTMLAAGVAHEIGNPLNSLNIHLQLLERKLKKAAPDLYESSLREMLEISTGEVKRLDFIVDQFLGAIRPSKPMMEPLQINDLIQEAVRFLQPEIEDRRIKITMELRSNLPLLQLDPGQIKQAFYNLMKNGAQSIGSDGEILIRSDMDDESVMLSVQDSGEGVSPETMSRIFEPYFTTKASGTGLGLLIVRRIVREHGGDVEFESEEGKGAKVTLHIPRVVRGVRMLEKI
jgi:two-component system, sporulation sensor kinase E